MRLDETRHYDTEPVERLLNRLNARKAPYEVEFAGLQLRIDEDVFCPTYTKTSAIMLEHLETCDVSSETKSLDLFTGSGVFALYMAKRGALSVGVDISQKAVTCAQANAVRNKSAKRTCFLLGDGFSAIPANARYDIVTACPPLLPGHADSIIEKALVDDDLVSTFEFVRQLPAYLSKDGYGLLFLSDVYQRVYGDFEELAAKHGLTAHIAHSKNVGYEIYQIVELRHAA